MLRLTKVLPSIAMIFIIAGAILLLCDKPKWMQSNNVFSLLDHSVQSALLLVFLLPLCNIFGQFDWVVYFCVAIPPMCDYTSFPLDLFAVSVIHSDFLAESVKEVCWETPRQEWKQSRMFLNMFPTLPTLLIISWQPLMGRICRWHPEIYI